MAEKQLSPEGLLVNDSHAEVLARRCFIRFIYNEINSLKENQNFKSELIERDSNKYKLRPDSNLILFISHTPCK